VQFPFLSKSGDFLLINAKDVLGGIFAGRSFFYFIYEEMSCMQIQKIEGIYKCARCGFIRICRAIKPKINVKIRDVKGNLNKIRRTINAERRNHKDS